ncbi:pyridoxamine 5'-phosphate oxidase family protein [Amycolatopsis acidiphila]|uniref:Pyridoxamine 5'-phosphate oxidase family protein n=1 Tax=Amycolatopsis acidiphila TaxID=715473 RepID=A0A558AF06_9PSEU|nr:pyridoxamine 5'-phosphate oxidase family protein [Amycolatopsis acidiphila]TVT22841.1 pyridoxamine 5'-phosphate oxidase family protein [Amycolatopsis acidiphila]UIJ58147.1 pyridoxamine 5'-phosphate oxidase family protein [Amycolatopsis acidiphila]GHG69801.1 pyridoxamine 5'-phosphate oxidase [Amycolatopsis acidiphila]
MVSWQEFTQAAPELAKQVRARFDAAESHVLATLRRDGAPRVSGTEVDFAGPQLMVGSMLGARKAQDLQRDGRYAIHAFPGGSGDVKLAGVATEVTDPAEIEAVQGNTEPCHLFRLDLAEVVLTEVAGTTLVVTLWRPGKSLVRFERPDNGPVVRIEL